MSFSCLFGKLPEELVRTAEVAQYELVLWAQALERSLYLEWVQKAPATLSRRARQKWSGRRLARVMRLRKELRIINALYAARGGLLGDSWTMLPSTPSLEAAKAQLRVLNYFDSLLKAYLNRWPRETITDIDKAMDEATAQCKAIYRRYWNGLE